jgi:hypothetical protein
MTPEPDEFIPGPWPEAEGAWNDPDWSLADEGLAPAPELPLALLRSCGPFVADYAAMKSAPPGYALGALLAAAAACIGAARKVQARPGWQAFPALWVLLVGNPSALKSPVLTPVTTILKDIERDEAKGFGKVRREFETKRKTAKLKKAEWETGVGDAVKNGVTPPTKPADADEPEEPKPPRIVVSDATIESMAPIFKRNPRGVILERDEIAGFVGNIGKYGGDGDAAFWLERYDGKSFSTDRVKSGNVEAPIGLMSLVGGIQPERLQEVLLDRPDDGFVARFLMIYPERVPRVWRTPIADLDVLKDALTKLRGLYVDLDGDRVIPRVIPIDPAAAELFAPWWQENGAATDASTGFRAGMLGKAGGVILRLSLVLEYLEWAWGNGPEPETVSRASVACAIGLFEEYLLPSACRVFGAVAREMEDMAAAMLLKQIRHRGERTVNAKTIYRLWGLPGLSGAKTVKAALERLEQGGWVRFAGGREGDNPGRRRSDWAVNPILWEASP